jgi:hypothetical protein
VDNISKHISYREATRSDTALRKGIDNTPSVEQLESMEAIAERVFEPLREWVGGPVKVNSFFRSPELNVAVGGSTKSQHCKGEAIDLDDTFGYKTNAEMFNYIKNNIEFDQLIWEFGDDENPAWVHVSYISPQNRRKCLKAYKEGGKTKYKTL